MGLTVRKEFSFHKFFHLKCKAFFPAFPKGKNYSPAFEANNSRIDAPVFSTENVRKGIILYMLYLLFNQVVCFLTQVAISQQSDQGPGIARGG